MKLFVYIIIILSFFNLGFGPVFKGKVKAGNKMFEKENYEEALKKYTDAQVDRPESPEIIFNIGNAFMLPDSSTGRAGGC